jgi:hypothetical protein
MTDIGDEWREHKQYLRNKNEKRKANAVAQLEKNNIKFRWINDYHIRCRQYDYWPSTGTFIHMKTKFSGDGIEEFLKVLGIKK